MSANVCRFCGAMAAEIVGRGYMSAFHCGSWHGGDSQWSQGIACRDRCLQIRVQLEGAVETLRNRIEAATQRLESLNGEHVGQAEIYAVIATLEGNSPENQEGSP